jgi:pimeloyl-ACP methyl ester carboxylesterase
MLPLADRTSGWSNDIDLLKTFALAFEGPLPFPVLIVHGTIDENVPLAHATGLAARLEAAGTEVESLTIEGAGHALFITHADVFGQAVARFVDGNR